MDNNKSVADSNLKQHLTDIREFIESFDMEDTEILMWDLLLYTFTCEDADNWDSKRRNSTMHFYKLLLNFVKGVHAIAIPLFSHFQHEIPANLRS